MVSSRYPGGPAIVGREGDHESTNTAKGTDESGSTHPTRSSRRRPASRTDQEPDRELADLGHCRRHRGARDLHRVVRHPPESCSSNVDRSRSSRSEREHVQPGAKSCRGRDADEHPDDAGSKRYQRGQRQQRRDEFEYLVMGISPGLGSPFSGNSQVACRTCSGAWSTVLMWQERAYVKGVNEPPPTQPA